MRFKNRFCDVVTKGPNWSKYNFLGIEFKCLIFQWLDLKKYNLLEIKDYPQQICSSHFGGRYL